MDNIISFRSQNFANNLATLMDKNAETPVELSERIEEDYETVMAWLNGDVPTQEKLYKLKNYYHVSVAYLTDEHHASSRHDIAREISAHIDDDTSEAEKVMIINYIENLKKSRQNAKPF